MEFQIKEEFYLDGKKIRLISGAVHYFRIAPTHWERTLFNLKAMGCNCVETYIPWNLHEPKKGEFYFEGMADIEGFLKIAQKLDLLIILRPSPYICAEWDFGGLPAWLLQDGEMRIRSQYSGYITAVSEYYQQLLPRLVPYQFTHGGNILMMQIENEYGSYGEDKIYLKKIKQLMQENGIDVPLFTSDGGWREVLDAGTIPDEHVLATVNFGTDAATNFTYLRQYQAKHQLNAPLMCMEFWDGWFNSWQTPIIRRDPQETAEEVRAVLKEGSINFYMFQGGTNFGFFNGCSDAGNKNLPQITSYDYDAPLTEWGMPTAKYFACQAVIKEEVPTAIITDPIYPNIQELGEFPVLEGVSLFSIIEELAVKTVNDYTLPMEKMGQNFGYLLYQTEMTEKRNVNQFKLVDAQDRAQIFINQSWIATQYQEELGLPIAFELPKEKNQLAILVENMGRNNYGPKLVADTQRKGIRSGVIEDIHYLADWTHWALPLDDVTKIDFTKEELAGTPSFYRSIVTVTEPVDTFLDCSRYGKGVIFVNGKNIGRYWQVGPVQTLFIPDYFWKSGENEVIIFETEGNKIEQLVFKDQPIMES